LTKSEASDIINNIIFAYHDSFDPSLPEEDREWNRMQFKQLRDTVVDLLSHPLKEEYEND
jgi:hypothetical protein